MVVVVVDSLCWVVLVGWVDGGGLGMLCGGDRLVVDWVCWVVVVDWVGDGGGLGVLGV